MREVTVRAPTLDDAHSVAALIAERDRVDFGSVDGLHGSRATRVVGAR
jgi:hypothetical protein